MFHFLFIQYTLIYFHVLNYKFSQSTLLPVLEKAFLVFLNLLEGSREITDFKQLYFKNPYKSYNDHHKLHGHTGQIV